ncbi:hypothetical protein [Tsukamurella ocularis]|uniref:hypothetical protein n=1 Tax=Tsukamurella ocularis TaxID=1970234 RepID=UPI002169F4F2|nr:hypothetical protein [Tsukamurella ocularis]MCS3779328.1 hypothetical protein [Tsukamurella ocularis]MCS3789946.1 hypothetical protein [Tsukamurella ocularis]MCS3852443.1 hypothetical protein [Tsukamurella ocularis]
MRSRSAGTDVWAALEVDGKLYCYLPASGSFHFNRGLTADWIWDRELDYQPITTAQVRDWTAAGAVGALDPVEHSAVLRSLLEARLLTDGALNFVVESD